MLFKQATILLKVRSSRMSAKSVITKPLQEKDRAMNAQQALIVPQLE